MVLKLICLTLLFSLVLGQSYQSVYYYNAPDCTGTPVFISTNYGSLCATTQCSTVGQTSQKDICSGTTLPSPQGHSVIETYYEKVNCTGLVYQRLSYSGCYILTSYSTLYTCVNHTVAMTYFPNSCTGSSTGNESYPVGTCLNDDIGSSMQYACNLNGMMILVPRLFLSVLALLFFIF